MGKGPEQSSEDVCGASCLRPAAPALAFVNKWCGLGREGVACLCPGVGGRLAADSWVLGGVYKVGLGI